MADDIGARVRAAGNLADVIAELLGEGLGFSCLEDNDKAMEWALRAYRAGQAAAPETPPVSVAEYQDVIEAMSDALWRVRQLAINADAAVNGWNLDPQKILDTLPDFAVPDGPRTWALPEDRERAKAAIHQPLHDLNVRIVDLAVGDCHCNLIAEVVLDALTDATPADGGGRE